MCLEPPVKRAPFVPPHRDPIPEDEPEAAPAAKGPAIESAHPVESETPPATQASAGPAPSEPVVVEAALLETVVIETIPVEPAAAPTPPAPALEDPVAKAETVPPPPDEFGAGLAT
jgi:hypothetical protein